MKRQIRELTRAEEEVMQILWSIERGVVNQILERFQDPRPAYNTISTIVRILEQKGFVGHRSYGRTHEYYPLIGKKEYSRFHFKTFMAGYFGNSYSSLASFFARDAELTIAELEELRKAIGDEIDQQEGGTENG